MANNNTDDRFQSFAEKMQSAGMPDIAISNFKHLYEQLLEGSSGSIPESSIQAVQQLPNTEDLNLQHTEAGIAALPKTVLLKLNGGLGTSMGLDKAKSLITIRQQLNFLDIIAQHALHSNVQLLLMNSFSTREDSLDALQKYPALNSTKLALDFVQHKTPKINQHDLSPASCTHNEQLEWHPPGHGDIYISLPGSGMLEELLNSGYRYALISNADNLGAVIDTQLLGYMVEKNIPFLMEVTDRTDADKKGGHLARLLDGRLVLRESAQCQDKDREEFANITKHPYFNTNNLWIDLLQLQNNLIENNNILDLPLIRNSKTLDPKDIKSSPVYQLETAMGSAISTIKGAQAIRVPRSRFTPIKTTDDLLLVRSDVYELNDNFTLTSKLPFTKLPLINLDNSFYKLIDDFETRFPFGPPSLLKCLSLDIKGDIVFGQNITIKGRISLNNKSSEQVNIPSGTCIDNDMNWD
jgi:UTP--glucose-1-phosphate uridylyltransferase